MPLCISCRGEYWVDKNATHSLSRSNLAQVYGRSEELQPYICARCGQSNEHWHNWSIANGLVHFSRFFFGFWGIQALISFLLPLVAYIPGIDFTPVASERIGIPLAILLIFVNVSLLYGLRDSLWRYDLLARVGRGFKPPLALLGITAFVLALIFGLAIVFMLEAPTNTSEAEPTQGVIRVITTIILAMTFVNVTLSAMFMAAHDYSNRLNREMPQPIFAQERRLLRMIVDGLREKIRQAMGEEDLRKRVHQVVIDDEILRKKMQQALDEDQSQEKLQQMIQDLEINIQQTTTEDDLRKSIQEGLSKLQEKIREIINEDQLSAKIQQAICDLELNVQQEIDGNELRRRIQQGLDELQAKIQEVKNTDQSQEKIQQAVQDLEMNVPPVVSQNLLQKNIQQRLNELQTKLREIMRADFRNKIQQAMGEEDAGQKIRQVTDKNKEVKITVADVERTYDAGVILLINAETEPDETSAQGIYQQLQIWRITTDRWGRIQKMQTEGTPRYIVIEKKPVEAEKDKKTENGKVESARVGELIFPGDTLNSQSDTTISITSSRRHWTN